MDGASTYTSTSTFTPSSTSNAPYHISLSRSQSQSQPQHVARPSSSRQSAHHRSSSNRSTATHPLSYHHDVVAARTTSPDRVSTTSSNFTSNTTPQLRKKPNLNSIKLHQTVRTTPTPTSTEFITTPTAPSFGSTATYDASPISQPTHKDLPRSQVSRTNSVSSAAKRPPASHSSYGVETRTGPPPSYDTQRTLSQERIRTVERSAPLRMTTTDERGQDPSSAVSLDEREQRKSEQAALSGSLQFYPSPDTADTQSIPTPTDGDDVVAMEVRDEQGLGVSQVEDGEKESNDSQKSEDLFLNIAKVDATRPPSSRTDRQRTRVSLPFLAQGRPSTSHRYSTRETFDTSNTPAQAEISQYYKKRASLGPHVPGAFTRTPTNNSVQREKPEEQSNVEESRAISVRSFGRRGSTTERDTLRPAPRTNTSSRLHKYRTEALQPEKPKLGEHIATESTISTTAPSTVWDELDDLKSRIRKLELTGKLPPSSAAAMSTAERPRTATTAPTTLSSSPKHNKVPAPLSSPIEGISSALHPLLHEALGNAQQVVTNDVYQKLQATAQDALQLASMMSYDAQAPRSGIPPATERQIRRRTESMCRSLTELAIALAADTKTGPTSYRQHISDTRTSPNITLRSRRYSNEQNDRPPASERVQSRLQSRRTSMQYGHSGLGFTSPEHNEPDSPKALPQIPSSLPNTRSGRTSTALRNRRMQGNLDGAQDEEDPSSYARPLSRAVTDSGTGRRFSRDPTSFSREYTSLHPMPTASAGENSLPTQVSTMPPGINANITTRRKYVSPSAAAAFQDSSPLAMRDQWGRISIVQQGDNTLPVVDTPPEAPGSSRSISTRRSFGFASRISNSVGNRLRAVKAERNTMREPDDSRSPREMSTGGGFVFDERPVEHTA